MGWLVVMFLASCATSNQALKDSTEDSEQAVEQPVSENKSRKTWRCETSRYSGEHAFTLQKSETPFGPAASVWIADQIRHTASFSVEGINQRWDFDNGKYAIVLSPDGSAAYYDFNLDANEEGRAKPRGIYFCKRQKK